MKKLFRNLRTLEEFLIGDYSLGHEKRRLFALTCLVFAVVIAFVSYQKDTWFGTTTRNFRPDLVSGLFALFLIAPLYVRNIVPWTGLNAYSILSLILNWAIVGSAANMALEGSSVMKLLGGEFPMTFLLALAVAFGWLGMRPVAMLSWAAFLLLGTINLSAASNTMGLWGFVFLVSSFLGVLLQADLSPRHLLAGFHFEFFGSPEPTKKEPPLGQSPVIQYTQDQ
ncbi:hypothetical protein KBY24_06795 [Ruegeria pomeroyi]|nr:hypothetical protein [Ruegeria pomeroyi]